MSLSVAERKVMAEKWMSVNKMEVVMCHIGANSIADVKDLARHAESIKVTAIAALPPFFYKCDVS
jgi:N-acetylneuraminate lyase